MSLSYSIDHISTSVEDVSVEVAAKSELTLRQVSTDPKTGEISAEYVLASGDDNFPATVTYRTVLQRRQGALNRRISMTFQTWATVSNSVTGEDEKKPISSTISMILPPEMTLELADLDDLLGNTFSFMYASVTTKVRDTAYLQKLLYGIPSVK